MNRKPLIAGNWKLHKNIAETKELTQAIAKKVQSNSSFSENLEVMICPTFTSLSAAKEMINGSQIKLGAQDLSEHESGAYTGEVSAEMLEEIGVSDVLIGHSERRQIFNENDDVIKAKVQRAFATSLNVVLCCGESLEIREANETDKYVTSQIASALEGVEAHDNLAQRLVIAYEPIWAIGTGKTCDSAEANRVIKAIRAKLADIFNAQLAEKIRILYGGSVKPSTIEEQMAQSDIDGALIGGASLKADDFNEIIEKTAAAGCKA